MCNCGPFYLNKKIRCWLSKEFDEACRLHDTDYNDEYLNRKQADVIFYNRMLNIAKNNKALKFKAWLYYRLVRLGGWVSYGKN